MSSTSDSTPAVVPFQVIAPDQEELNYGSDISDDYGELQEDDEWPATSGRLTCRDEDQVWDARLMDHHLRSGLWLAARLLRKPP